MTCLNFLKKCCGTKDLLMSYKEISKKVHEILNETLSYIHQTILFRIIKDLAQAIDYNITIKSGFRVLIPFNKEHYLPCVNTNIKNTDETIGQKSINI